ncbi:right-handed parallel beta-helix repeat-containing protein [Solwaraspora sp. WMMD791]|uniref:right-handed parallel beta-helix repeat-containing protein n=1 Tax=Solwaraspora sp. WMMD791 TaxID=3016086 RepID=UPI00249AF070|nr:right-handed parallel beta-helix repeat-containing protein [Solwaraspora sp. WMMD791]WFE26368.1 right-handed parallel beta-helix repeat-containing protein [Solwaraspora sp. WMMD791]
MPSRGRSRRRGLLAALGATAVSAALIVTVTTTSAQAATLFADNFDSGGTGSWSKSGGNWEVVTDGSPVLRQDNTGSELARFFAGSTGWTDYQVQARVKPLSFNGTNRLVGIASRVTSNTKMYRLALINNNRAELQAVNGSSITVIGSASLTVSTGTWYTLRIDASGSTIRGFVDGTQIGAGTDTAYSSGRIALVTSYAGASFDDVSVDTVGSGPTPTTPAPNPTTPAPDPTTPAPHPTTPPPTSPPPSGSTLYVAPGGSDTASGTISNPTTLTSAITRIPAGGTIYLRGGTYRFSQTITIGQGNNGTSSARKKLYAYPGETPVLNFSAQSEDPANRGIELGGSYWHFLGIIVERAGDNGILLAGNNNIIERTVTRHNRDSGLQLSRLVAGAPRDQWPANNLVLSSVSHDNVDSDGEDADGFAPKLTVGTGNVFRYTVAHNNIDDGYDLYTKSDTGAIGAVTIEYSLAYDNGTLSDGSQAGNGDRNGYKLGGEDIGVNHLVRGNIAYGNGKHGFTYNRNLGTMTVSNNVGVGNEERNFNFDGGSSVFRGNTSCDSGSTDRIVGNSDSSNQFWSGSNGSRCSSYSGALGWSFAADGRLVVTFGGRVVTP